MGETIRVEIGRQDVRDQVYVQNKLREAGWRGQELSKYEEDYGMVIVFEFESDDTERIE